MDMASCGPSNALQNLSKHTQRDNTLQNEVIRNQPQQGNGFRNQSVVDQRLNQEFQQFTSGQTLNQFQPEPVHQQFHQHHRQHNHPQYSQHQPQQGWIQDFSNMSINQQPGHQTENIQNGKVQNDWHKQFMKQHQSSQQPLQNNVAYQPQHQMGGFQMNMRTNLSNSLYQTRGNMTEHKEIHKMEEENQIFDAQFDQLERELQEEQMSNEQTAEVQMDSNEFEKEQFAKTAQQVQESMLKGENSEASAKFKNSNFLKLMSSISNRSVELSAEGDKLVSTESGEDIRDNPDLIESQSPTPAPLSNHQEHINRIPTSRDDTPTQESLTLHLPDPLAHIKKGSVEGDVSPFQAAQIVSGNQVKASDWMEEDDWLDMTEDAPFPVMGGPQRAPPAQRRPNIMSDEWQEVYDDYKHDDDFN
mmetsp:Transcript_7775/g.9801  ORF Transcript_7775/g.9801 Transcript_7775/m.9801 type:complete len:416 (+) Transcript_7775:1473-2720(+)